MTPGEWIAVITAVGTAVVAIFTVQVNRLRERDKLQFDLATQALTAKVATLTADVTECRAECTEHRTSIGDLAKGKEQADMRSARLEGENASLTRENRDLRDEVLNLRDRLYGSGKV